MTMQHWIEAVLYNDDGSSDCELVEHFMTEGPMNRLEAEQWVARRDEYLCRRRFVDVTMYPIQ